MNFCRECGSKLNEMGNECPKCGVKYGVKSEITKETVSNTYVKINVLSIIGMVFGIVSIIFSLWGILSVVAIILSSIARRQIADHGESGDGMAITGLSCGIISLLIIAIFLGIDPYI